jgi:hypothetical protein
MYRIGSPLSDILYAPLKIEAIPCLDLTVIKKHFFHLRDKKAYVIELSPGS